LLLSAKLARLQAGGITQINISLDTLRRDRFEEIARRKGHDRVIEAIEATVSRGYDPVKVNCVVMRGVNDDELPAFVALAEDWPVQVRFIEYMPFSGNGWDNSAFVPYREMLDNISRAYPGLRRLSDGRNDTSKSFGVPGHRGSVGFITSMSEHFCDSCNRLRITADGSLKVCLFGRSEISLRDMMRRGDSDEELAMAISAAVSRKEAAHAGMDQLPNLENRPMILIGG
jgi:cyclic pyranopterin phosphate synthase